MALFNKEPEKNPKTQPTILPQTSITPTPATSTAAPAAAPRANGPASADGRAYLDRGSKISGKISFEGPARIDGEVDGEISAKDSLTIGESAVITAHIRAASVSVAGKVSGDIVATQRIEIRPSAKVSGNITAPVLSVTVPESVALDASLWPRALAGGKSRIANTARQTSPLKLI